MTSVALTVSVESQMSTVAKKSRSTTPAQPGEDVEVDIEALRPACVLAMTQMLGEGFRFATRVHYDEVKPLLTPEKSEEMRIVTIKFCEVA